jgi:hypothetical protein
VSTDKRDMLPETGALLPALRYIADNPDKQLSFVTGRFQVTATDLWAWFEQFNGGKKDISHTRIDSVALKAGVMNQPPSAKPAAAAPDSARNEPNAGTDPDDGKDPWLKSGRRPHARAVKSYRAQLEELALGAGSTAFGSGPWYGFRKKWLGTGKPAPAKVARFLKWVDSDPAAEPATKKPARQPRAAKKAGKVRQAKLKKGKRKYTRRAMLPEPVQLDTLPQVGKPPVGIRPRWLVDEQRVEEITAAMLRYLKAGVPVPNDWILELAEKLEARKATHRVTVPYAELAGGAD